MVTAQGCRDRGTGSPAFESQVSRLLMSRAPKHAQRPGTRPMEPAPAKVLPKLFHGAIIKKAAGQRHFLEGIRGPFHPTIHREAKTAFPGFAGPKEYRIVNGVHEQRLVEAIGNLLFRVKGGRVFHEWMIQQWHAYLYRVDHAKDICVAQ